MRQKFNPQWNLFTTMARNQIAKELQQMSKVLDATPKVVELAYQDLTRVSRHENAINLRHMRVLA